MDPFVASLADELVATSFRQSPLSAALLGLDEIEGDLDTVSTDEERVLIARYDEVAVAAEQRFTEVRDDGSPRDDLDTLALDHLRLTARARSRRLALPLSGFTVSNYYAAPLASVLSVLPQLPLASSLRQDRYLRRLRALGPYLDSVAGRHRESIGAGLVPTRRGVVAAIAQLDTMAADPELGGVRRHGDELDEGFMVAQDDAIAEVVRPALASYRRCLEDEVLEHGRPDDRCGLSWLPGGDGIYRELIELYTWSHRTGEEVHTVGLELIDRLKVEFAEIGARLWGTSDFDAIRDRILTDGSLHFDTSEEILATAIAAVRHAEEVAPKWFGIVPREPCAVSPIPDALASGSAVAYYYGGALDGSRPGTYFVNTTKPQQRNRHVAESIAYHEAVPGHHFQLTIAQELSGSHLVFRVTRDVANAEGWGLYSERLADEMGLYTDDVSRLGMLTTDAMRAARLVVDTGLHALGWSRQQAIDWMTENVPIAEIEIVQEIDRYIVSPGQALAYMFGRIEIERCRNGAASALGDAFDLRAFHDMVLTTGPVALPALTSAVQRWIARLRA
jgi:uncharacterized protein (DUF885 family)